VSRPSDDRFLPLQLGLLGRDRPLEYTELAPPPQLSGRVLLFWSIESRARLERGFHYRIVPDGCVDLVFDLRGGGAWLYGASDAALAADLAGDVDFFGVRLRPGRLGRTLGLSGGGVSRRVVALDQAIGSRASGWSDELAAAPTRALRAAAAARRLADLEAGSGSPADRLAEAIADAVVGSGGALGVEQLARRFAVSSRHAARLCRRAAGLSPKQLGRVIRFQRALRSLASGSATLAALAADHGYFDQAHMTGEFRDLLGATPAAAARALRGSGISKNAPDGAR